MSSIQKVESGFQSTSAKWVDGFMSGGESHRWNCSRCKQAESDVVVAPMDIRLSLFPDIPAGTLLHGTVIRERIGICELLACRYHKFPGPPPRSLLFNENGTQAMRTLWRKLSPLELLAMQGDG